MKVKKRDGSIEEFQYEKIEKAVNSAFKSCNIIFDYKGRKALNEYINILYSKDIIYDVNNIEDSVENFLMASYPDVAKSYIVYRNEHKNARFIKERLEYIKQYKSNTEMGGNASTISETDSNANVTVPNVSTLAGEVYKTTNRLIIRQFIKEQLYKDFPEVAKQYSKDLDNHIIYAHDESNYPIPFQYCMAVSLYPLMLNGVGNIDNVTPSAPNDLQSFSGQITNLIFLLSSQCKGAVAVSEYFIALNYYVVKEFGEDWYNKLNRNTTSSVSVNKRTVKNCIHKAFKQFIYGINQPAGNRGFQSPFTNISYFDSNYFNSLFEDFVYPDGSKPEWKAIDTLQRLFIKFFNDLRTKQILTFPVESFCMVHDGKDIIDKDYKKLCAKMYSEGHSFFTYISDSVDSLASCCFTKDTKVAWRSSKSKVSVTSLESLYNLDRDSKKNLTILHNGNWIKGRPIKLPNRQIYKVITHNNKEILVTDNHINPTLRGDIATKDLTLNDYLLFNTSPLQALKNKDENLTYEMGYVIGMFLGDGSFNRIDGVVKGINFSLSKTKYDVGNRMINKCAKQLHESKRTTIHKKYNNVYPVSIYSEILSNFIIKWTHWEKGTHANTKKLNLECLTQSIEFRQGILDGWYLTDGGNSNRCYTTSKELAENMELLLTSLGKQSIINISDRTHEKVIIREESFNRNYPLYCVRWYSPDNNRSNKDSENTWIKRNNSIYFKIKSIEPIDYKDDVYCIECSNKDEPYFTLPNGVITHNCRLKSNLQNNTFNPTTGLNGVMTGSCNVITLNMNRILQDFFREKIDYSDVEQFQYNSKKWYELNKDLFKIKFREYLTNILERVYKYHKSYRNLLYDFEDSKMYASSNANYIRINKLYSTIGINGMNECCMFLGLEISNNKEYLEFLQYFLTIIKEENSKNSEVDIKYPCIFNSEFVPKRSGYFKPLVIDLEILIG